VSEVPFVASAHPSARERKQGADGDAP